MNCNHALIGQVVEAVEIDGSKMLSQLSTEHQEDLLKALTEVRACVPCVRAVRACRACVRSMRACVRACRAHPVALRSPIALRSP